MKKSFKRGLALAGALLVASMGVGCGGEPGNGGGGGVGGKSENCLDVYCHKAGYGVQWCKDLLEEFVKQDWVKAKYEGISYTFNSTDQDGYTKSKLVATNNNTFDLLFGFNGDKPQDMSLLEELTQDVYKQTVPGESVTYEEKLFSTYAEVNNEIDVNNLDAEKKYYTASWAGGMNGIFYNEDILNALGYSVPRTTNELTAICNAIYELRTNDKSNDVYEGYAFIQSKGLGYWIYMLPQWWAQYEGVDGYNDYWNGTYYGESSKEIFKQQGRLESLKLVETYLDYDKHLNPESMGESYTYKIAQGLFLRGKGVFHVNGDWFENEMKEKKAEIKSKEGLDYSIKLMRTPIVSALGTKLGITDAQLAATVDYVDGKTSTAPAGVSEDAIAAVREARGVVHSIGANHTAYVPSYAKQKGIAKDFLLFMATDKVQEIYMNATGGSSLPFKYDVKTKNPTLYASLTQMQKERIDYFNSSTVSVSVLAAKEAFPLCRFGGLGMFSISDNDCVAALSMNNKTKTAQDIYNDTLTYWGFNLDGSSNDNQRWNTALSKSGLK